MTVSPAETTIRTFRGPDAHAALSAVKAAFGQDAVILETKQLSGGLFGRAQVEIVAASGGGPMVARTAAFERAAARAAGSVPRVESPRKPSGNRLRAEDLISPSDREDDARAVDKDASKRREERNDGVHTELASLRRTIEQIRRRVIDGKGGGVEHDWPSDARKLFTQLTRQGLDEPLAEAAIEAALQDGAERGALLNGHVARGLARRVPVADAPWSRHARRTIAFVGPTGVGKTTAMAKIAARALLDAQFKVALITVDTYRVGASDQLARYGKIMGVPTFVARDAQALGAAYANCREADLVLIDTAGRADAASNEEQAALVRTVPNVQLHLTLSAASGSREIAAAARRFQKLAPERFIFTKLDEADGPASIFAAMGTLQAPISCICDGQRVPEDIHDDTSAQLVTRLFGLTAPAGEVA